MDPAGLGTALTETHKVGGYGLDNIHTGVYVHHNSGLLVNLNMMETEPSHFLRLPLELREAIYSLYFKAADRLVQNHALEPRGFRRGVQVRL